ncbi:MAG: uracil-DNA glycosylase [Proteobacteria bacterium]|nr:uracil-DNA glycosylase [Pseudomonadota bacterium]
MRLNTIAREIRACTRCGLHKGRQKAIPGEGPGGARIMLVGEAPGREEDIQGRPFVGRSGRLLDESLKKAGLRRGDLFITSVVKCRPPKNRIPLKCEWEKCIQAHLWRQIDAIDPAIICLLGGVATKALLGMDRLSEGRGRIFRRGNRVFFPTYHPAGAGRNATWYRIFSEDMARLHSLAQSK